MNTVFSTWLIIAYGLSILGYIGRFFEGIPNVGILTGMVIITMAYGSMFLSKVYKKNESKKKDESHKKADDNDVDNDKKSANEGKTDEKTDMKKVFTIIGYSLASVFFFAIHIFPQLTFTVRFYDIFGAVGYGFAAIGTALIPFLLPFGYAITSLYYIFGSYQKTEESGWIDRIQLISRTVLALVYGVTALSLTNVNVF